MKKEDFVRAIMKNDSSLKKVQAEKAFDAVVAAAIYEGLKDEETIRLPKIGTFSVVTRKPTTYYNPKTREKIEVGEMKRIKFSISEIIKSDLAEGNN